MVFILGSLGLFMLARQMGAWPSDRRFEDSFNRISPGMTENEVVRILGAPTERSRDFRLAQPHGYDKEYAEAAKSGCDHYLLWRRGGHFVYAVGFTRDGKYCYAARGGT